MAILFSTRPEISMEPRSVGVSSGMGVVFEMTPSNGGWTEAVIHSFTGADGAYPESGVIFDTVGDLDGTTTLAGHSRNGNVYQLIPSGSGWMLN